MSDRKSLIRLASTLSKGSKERRAILAGLKQGRDITYDLTAFVDHIGDWDNLKTGGGQIVAEKKDKEKSIRLTMSEDGNYTLDVKYSKKGKVRIPYEDHYEDADDFLDEHKEIKSWLR